MEMRLNTFLVLMCMMTSCRSQKWKKTDKNMKELLDTRTCSNLTQVLDNWKFAIMTQVKELLIHDHASVLPEYNRIRPLSDALGELYSHFNSLKTELVQLSAKVDSMEGFMDDLKLGRRAAPPLSVRSGLGSALRAQMRLPARGILTQHRQIHNRMRRPLAP
ncbi:uncharacterized protein ACB058_020666 [Synchiropus picturatus]